MKLTKKVVPRRCPNLHLRELLLLDVREPGQRVNTVMSSRVMREELPDGNFSTVVIVYLTRGCSEHEPPVKPVRIDLRVQEEPGHLETQQVPGGRVRAQADGGRCAPRHEALY